MTIIRADSKLFEEITRELLEQGLSVRFQARGSSMFPTIRGGEMVEIVPVAAGKLRKGDIVLGKCSYGFRAHRIVVADHAKDIYITRGDSCEENDSALKGAQILGVVQGKEVLVGRKVVLASFRGVSGWGLRSAARVQLVLSRLWRKVNSNHLV